MTDISASEVELLRARLKAIVLALSTKEQKELLRMIKEGRAAKAENCTAKTECSNGGIENSDIKDNLRRLVLSLSEDEVHGRACHRAEFKG